jgi:hypothetical protein
VYCFGSLSAALRNPPMRPRCRRCSLFSPIK